MAAAAASSPFPAASKLAAAHPPPEGVKYAYGTAGFRMRAELLDAAVVRMGMLAALRAKQTGKVSHPLTLALPESRCLRSPRGQDPALSQAGSHWRPLGQPHALSCIPPCPLSHSVYAFQTRACAAPRRLWA